MLGAAVLAACASRSVGSPVPPNATAGAAAPAATSAASPAPPALPPAWKTRAAAYLDRRVREDLDHPLQIPMLKQQGNCTANCHTTLPYVTARALLPGDAPARDDVRRGVAERVAGVTDWSTAAPWFVKSDKIAAWSIGSEAVVDAAALVDDDNARGRPLSADSLRALDLMWSKQRSDGAWDWFAFGLEPWETTDDCGAALAAALVSHLPGDARAHAQTHVDGLASYVRKRMADAAHPPELHQKVFFLWASAGWKELLDDGQRQTMSNEISAKQRPDGGWSLATWGGGDLADPNGASDGYATAIATLALCETHAAASSVSRGLAWLIGAQRPDGAFPGHSVNEHAELLDKFETDMATSFAAIALTRCHDG
jgi:squalene-hopene/tetraprenyl-beta-curcumene cyclase